MRYFLVGGAGSLGQRLIARLLPTDDVAVYSRDEAKHWTLRNELRGSPLAPRLGCLEFFVGDVRDEARLTAAVRAFRPDVIIAAAALKQVDTCEGVPDESVATNVIGTQSVVRAAEAYGRGGFDSTVLFVSTDKACSPVSVYGMCKALSERLVTSRQSDRVRYLATRYGNVLESRGSILPLFRFQSLHAESLTLTDPNMTRFLMTLDESVDLILDALRLGSSGETWIPSLPSMRIGDLAALFSSRTGKPISITGMRPGERLHELLINEEESVRVTKSESRYVIAPISRGGAGQRFTYSSGDTVLTPSALEARLDGLGLLDAGLERFTGSRIEEIRK